ncbi:MAG: alpha/beta fold hydrolase, partial [Clostridia bacterium]|nr:alpha/beta fold hydrolase [Clostridia bacterium]
VAAFLLVNVLVVAPVVTVIVYETVFSHRFENQGEFALSDFQGLLVEECTFPTEDGVLLAGYRYYKSGQQVNGVVVLCHGLGCGGQNSMMPFADFFTTEGYLVFAYDATGNGNSPGDSVKGLPQGLIDLDHALRYVKADSQYQNFPIFLLGHSWGAYSAGAVLNLHPDVSAAVLISGPDTSLDLMLQSGKDVVGAFGYTGCPYLMLYERLKFGDYASYSVSDGLRASDTAVFIVHSKDDTTVPPEIGYHRFFDEFQNDSQCAFLLYEDRGHDTLYFSQDAETFELDTELMTQICRVFQTSAR